MASTKDPLTKHSSIQNAALNQPDHIWAEPQTCLEKQDHCIGRIASWKARTGPILPFPPRLSDDRFQP